MWSPGIVLLHFISESVAGYENKAREMVDRIKSRYYLAFAELLAKCNSEA